MNLRDDFKKTLRSGASFDTFQEMCAILHGMTKFGETCYYIDLEPNAVGKGIVYLERNIELEPLK